MGTTFTDSELKEVRRKLEQRLADIDEATLDLEDIKNLTDENYSDPYDRATMESDRNLDIRIKERKNKLAAKIRKTIERIDNGVYQVCKMCGEEISKARLLARAVTDLCIDCKERQEQEERISG